MNEALKIFLSMSCSGGVLILALLLGKRLLKDKLSRQWQYYIWLVVVLRLLLPFGPEVSLLGKTYQAVDQAATQSASLPLRYPAQDMPGAVPAPAVGLEQKLQDIWSTLINDAWMVWLAVALGLLLRKITTYQSFIRYIHAGLTPVSDIELLDRLSIVAQRAGMKRPVELCVNPLISSPLLIGFFHPCILLPGADIAEKEFHYIALHELTHYKRRDMFYKWLVQVTVCLHWFNPLVHLMGQEITKACEFSCDEAVLVEMGSDHARDYGKTLLDAMAEIGRYKENFGAVTLGANKRILKERIGAIMNFKKKSMAIRLLTGVLTLCVIAGAAFAGVYSAAAVSDRSFRKPPVSGDSNFTPEGTDARSGEDASRAERYYKAGSLPLFEMTFPRLDENAQKTWLEKFYADGDFAFFSVAARGLDTDSSLFADFAKRAYDDEEIAFFSTLADCMDETELELWLDRALEDGKWDFQSMLSDRLGKRDEFDELKEEKDQAWAAVQEAEYQAAGVTMDGGDYYYQGQLVNIFLDIRSDKAFYTLHMNPAGTVNIKIIRDADNIITGAVNMTEAEVTELPEDMRNGDDE